MSHAQIQEFVMKLVDVDETHPDPSQADVSADADTQATPRLRPEVLGDAAQRRTKAMVHASLFKGADEAPTIGPYQVLKWLGEGGMGVVYAAYDDKLERKVALKLIRGAALQRPQGRARTLREARALARLSHPNVVHVYQVGEVDDEVFVAMEFLTGPTLRAWLAAQPRSWREVLAVFRQAGEGLAAAHRQGVVHRDFKPANVIVGDDGRVRVVDFGLAHLGDSEALPELPAAGEVTDVLLTQTGAVLGTPAYMAAEQFAGARGDAKTDQYSFCAALYEALYGQRPFVGADVQALATAVAEGRVRAPKSGQEVPAWLHRVVLRGLQPDPATRWPSMDALLQALQPAEARLRGRFGWAPGSDIDAMYGLRPFVDDAGQVTVIGEEGWNCWWDEQHGARVGAQPLTGWVFELPRGVARVVEAEVEVWTGPDQRAQRFTAAAKVVDLQASPSGRLLAVRSEKGVELLAIDSGAVTPVVTEASPLGSGELTAGALAWSPDSAQLAVLKPLTGSLELTRWDVSGAPRELERRVLKDSPGRPRNLVAFTPSGKSLVLTASHESLMRVVGPTITVQTATPELAAFAMRDEDEAIGLDFQGGPFMIGIMAGGMTPLTPNPDLGSSTKPPIRRAADGTGWACDALGPGTLLRWAPFAAETPEAVRERIAGLAAAL